MNIPEHIDRSKIMTELDDEEKEMPQWVEEQRQERIQHPENYCTVEVDEEDGLPCYFVAEHNGLCGYHHSLRPRTTAQKMKEERAFQKSRWSTTSKDDTMRSRRRRH